MPRPSPVLMKALVLAAKMRPAPPVASSTVLPCRMWSSPVSISSAVTPTTSPSASRIRSSAIHSTKNCVLRLDVLLVQRVQHRVAGAVGCRAGALHGLLAVVGRVAAERTLVDGAVGIAVERHAEVLELVDDLGRLAAHELDGVLVAEPVGTLDGVEEMVVPVVFRHVAQRRADAALRGDRVRAGREDLGQHGHVQASAGQLQRGTHAGATGTDDDHVELALGDRRRREAHVTVSRAPGSPSRHNPPATPA